MSSTLLSVVTVPDLAIVLLIGGILLIYLEFNRPGRIVYGCLGALSLMYSVSGLMHLKLSSPAIGLLCAGFLLLVIGCRYPIYGLVSLVGTTSIAFGLCTLIRAAGGHPGIDIAAAIIFSVATTLLGRIALLARQNKRRPSDADLQWN